MNIDSISDIQSRHFEPVPVPPNPNTPHQNLFTEPEFVKKQILFVNEAAVELNLLASPQTLPFSLLGAGFVYEEQCRLDMALEYDSANMQIRSVMFESRQFDSAIRLYGEIFVCRFHERAALEDGFHEQRDFVQPNLNSEVEKIYLVEVGVPLIFGDEFRTTELNLMQRPALTHVLLEPSVHLNYKLTAVQFMLDRIGTMHGLDCVPHYVLGHVVRSPINMAPGYIHTYIPPDNENSQILTVVALQDKRAVILNIDTTTTINQMGVYNLQTLEAERGLKQFLRNMGIETYRVFNVETTRRNNRHVAALGTDWQTVTSTEVWAGSSPYRGRIYGSRNDHMVRNIEPMDLNQQRSTRGYEISTSLYYIHPNYIHDLPTMMYRFTHLAMELARSTNVRLTNRRQLGAFLHSALSSLAPVVKLDSLLSDTVVLAIKSTTMENWEYLFKAVGDRQQQSEERVLARLVNKYQAEAYNDQLAADAGGHQHHQFRTAFSASTVRQDEEGHMTVRTCR